MLLPIFLLLQDSTVATAVAEYREKTRAVVKCERPKDDEEIVVCARREAYRYQTLFVGTGRASNATEQDSIVWSREAQGHVECGKGAFLVRCGSVGVGVTVSGGGVRSTLRQRPD